MTVILLLMGLALLLIGGEALVRGAVALAYRYRLSPLFVGMVIVGAGTSMPELVVGVTATLGGSSPIAIGNVFGSNIANVLLILAAASLVRPIPSPPNVLKPDGIILLLITLAVVLLTLQGTVYFWQGLVMVMLMVALISADYLRVRSRTDPKAAESESPPPKGAEASPNLMIALLLLASGFATLLFGADMLVDAAVVLARHFGVSEDVIGLTIIAVGTSLPELGSALAAARAGHTDLAYGNVIGSNLFNLLAILGSAAMAGPLVISQTIPLVDGTVMLLATAFALYFVASGAKLVRWEGMIMLLAYVLYLGLRTAYSVA